MVNIDSVADIGVRRDRALLSVPAKVGLALMLLVWYLTRDLKLTLIVGVTHGVLHALL
jgi:hypothetical protein